MKVRLSITEVEVHQGEIMGESFAGKVIVHMSADDFEALKNNNGQLIRLHVEKAR